MRDGKFEGGTGPSRSEGSRHAGGRGGLGLGRRAARVERGVGFRQDPAEWVRCWFVKNMARPSELDAENRSGKTVSTAATAYFFMGDPTHVGGG